MQPITIAGRSTVCLAALLFVGTSVAISGCSGGSTGGGFTSSDTTRPTLTSNLPTTNATNVALNTKVLARFSEAMNASTVTAATFTLAGPGGAVAGSVTYDAAAQTAQFTPSAELTTNTSYTATVSTGAQDAAGNSLATAAAWGFQTGVALDATAPTVTFTFPTTNASNVALNTRVTARFGEAMDEASLLAAGTFTLTGPGGAVAGSVTYDAVNQVAEFTPAAALTAGSSYTARVSTGAIDVAGNSLAAAFSWSFGTGTAADATAPTVTSRSPASGAVGVATNATITPVFSEPMDTNTITTTSFTLQLNGVTSVAGAVKSPGTSTTATFTPSASLSSNSSYTATLTTTVADLAGNSLASAVVWTFQTGAGASMGPAAVNLGSAGAYAILAKSAISTTGTTAIVGDLGLSPSAGSFFTGFSETLDATNRFATAPVVTGQMFAADYATPTPANLTTAVLDMETAYNDAAGRVSPDATELGAGNLDGLVIAPGLYKWGTGVMIPNNVTLNGGANDRWIFQVAGDLTVGNGATVTLTGGALAKNIVWQVVGQCVLGTTSNVKGIILCKTQIACQTSSVVTGRTMAQTAVTLDATSVTSP